MVNGGIRGILYRAWNDNQSWFYLLHVRSVSAPVHMMVLMLFGNWKKKKKKTEQRTSRFTYIDHVVAKLIRDQKTTATAHSTIYMIICWWNGSSYFPPITLMWLEEGWLIECSISCCYSRWQTLEGQLPQIPHWCSYAEEKWKEETDKCINNLTWLECIWRTSPRSALNNLDFNKVESHICHLHDQEI